MVRPIKPRTPRILLYGFGPYRRFTDNITARIINSLPRKRGLKKTIFPVRFDRGQFVESIRKYQPEVILGLGQSSRQTIAVEMKARNWRRSSKSKPRRPIAKHRPKTLPTTLAINAGQTARRSYSAGDYVCNYSMYVMLEAIARKKLAVRYGFVHVPHDYPFAAARRYVAGLVRQCRKLAPTP